MQQYTFDGKLEDINFIGKEKPIFLKKLTIKEKFRQKYGTDKNVRCRDCKYLKKIEYNDKHYYKCEIIGISNSSATDIKLKDYGCLKYVKGG